MKIYLAIQYTGKEKESFEYANNAAGELMMRGHIVFSPISHTHPIALACDMQKNWKYWKTFDEPFIEWCDAVYICAFGDWRESRGVLAEIEIAKHLNKEIIYGRQP